MEKYKSLSDEIKEAKERLYWLLFLSIETKVYKLTDNEREIMKFLTVDKQIQQAFKKAINGEEPK
jgi:hypothetical protein